MELVARLRAALADESAIAAGWLFGSHARGRARPDSDVDVAVWCDPPMEPMERFDLEARLAERTGLPIDLVVLEDAPADLVHRVFRDGVLLVDRDRAGRLRMEVRRRNEYFDMSPVWRRIRRLPPGVEP